MALIARRFRARPGSARRRGFTLVEAAVVFAVLVVISGVLLLRIADSADPRNDAAAKASLQVFQQAQLEAGRDAADPLSAVALTAASDVDKGAVTFVDGASSSVSEVGVLVSGSVVSGVARSGRDCWMLRLDLDPSPSSPPTWWFLQEDVEVCDATGFGPLSFPSDGSGQSPNEPTLLG
jgi:type II secretory pathway pseudopilin PulG